MGTGAALELSACTGFTDGHGANACAGEIRVARSHRAVHEGYGNVWVSAAERHQRPQLDEVQRGHGHTVEGGSAGRRLRPSPTSVDARAACTQGLTRSGCRC